jgi:hypothetical protein
MTFYFLSLYLWLMGWVHKADWTVTFLVTSVFTAPISSAKVSGHSIHLVLAFSFKFCACFSTAFVACVAMHAWFF